MSSVESFTYIKSYKKADKPFINIYIKNSQLKNKSINHKIKYIHIHRPEKEKKKKKIISFFFFLF